MKKITLFSLIFLIFSSIHLVNAIPNPASVYCHEQGYQLSENSCIFPDNTSCIEWQYYCKCMPNGIGCWPGNFSCDYPCNESQCKKAGESSFVFGCCAGLQEIEPIILYDRFCRIKEGFVGWTYGCSDCGNNICEKWENECTCPKDCKISIVSRMINFFMGIIGKLF